MTKAKTLLALDVGTVRVGVAVADTAVKLAIPLTTLEVNDDIIKQIINLVILQDADTVVIGYPRNQSGESTAQTEYVEQFADQLKELDVELIFQDESLTSVMAEERLKERGRPYQKADIDAEAAVIILQDYIESNIA